MKFTNDQLKALDLNRNLAITAGAGSGKTSVLVRRYLHCLMQNPDLDIGRVLAITYTEKAAAEMKERIFQEISDRFEKETGQRNRLFELLNQLHDAQIFTIHAFCSRVLRQYPVEAGVSPDYRVLDDLQIDELLNQVFRDFFLSYQLTDAPSHQLKLTALGELSIHNLRKLFFSVYNNRSLVYQFISVMPHSDPDELKAKWEEWYIEYHQQVLQPLLEDRDFWHGVSQIAEAPLIKKNTAQTVQVQLKELYEQFCHHSQNSIPGITAVLDILKQLTTGKGEAYRRIPGGKTGWGEEGASLFQTLSEIASRFTDLIIPMNPDTEAVYSQIFTGMGLILLEFLQEVEKYKSAQNALDFDDLQLATLGLLQNNPDIRQQLRHRYRFLLVDEFQDTDVLQHNILQLLSRDELGHFDRDRLFVVGDPKQSIYGFRHADVTIFQELMEQLPQQGSAELPFVDPGTGQPLKSTPDNRKGIITLSENFRSSSNLIAFFNSCFEPLFVRDSEYDVPFQKLKAARSEPTGLNPVIRLEIFQNDSPQKLDLIKQQANRMAETAKEIGETGNFRKPAGEDQPELAAVSYGDIAVLIRSRNHLEIIEQTFREYGVPYQTYKGTGFFRRQEVRDLYFVLRSLANPDDDFALLTFLRSTYVGLSDVTLFYLSRVRGINYWEKLQKFGSYLENPGNNRHIFQDQFKEFMKSNQLSPDMTPGEKESLLRIVKKHAEWNDLALQGKFSQLVDRLVEELHIRPLLAVQPDSEQKLANLDKFLHYVFDFEQSHSGLLADFLDTLQNQLTGERKEGEATIMAEDENKVNILTYHSAKGMEFPVVFLPFVESKFQYNSAPFMNKNRGYAFNLERSTGRDGPNPFLYEYLKKLDRQKTIAEEKRLFYVAVTRAQDHLMLFGAMSSQNKSSDTNYLQWLLNAFRIPATGSGDQVPDEEIYHSGDAKFAIRRHRISAPPELIPSGASSVTPGFSGHFFIPEHLKYQLPVAEKPGNQMFSVTQLMLYRENKDRYFRHFYLKDGRIQPPQVELEHQDEPGGALWGSMVHRLLEDFQVRREAEDRQKIKQLILQLGMAGSKEQSSLENKLNQLIQNVRASDLNSLLSGKEQYSEYGVDMRVGPFILRGIFDRLFRNENGLWAVMDFKTNHIRAEEVERTAQKYRFQMQAYALLLSGLYPGQQYFPVSLYFLDPMKSYRQDFTPDEIADVRSEILKLMRQILEIENLIFYS